MAHQEKSAGDGATPGSVVQTGTSSLDQARDARSDEAFFIGTSAEALNTEIGGLSDLGPQLEMVLELIRTGRGEAGGPADSLVCVAMARLSEIVKDLESIQIDFERRSQHMGYTHD